MVEMEHTLPEDRGRPLARPNMGSTGANVVNTSLVGSNCVLVTSPEGLIAKAVGRPCAAGCGHYCWVSSGMSSVNEP